MNKGKFYQIFIISNEEWGEMRYSKHNFALELSKNHQVYFVDPPKKWRIRNIFSLRSSIESIKNNLTVIKYDNNLPVRVFKRFFLYLNDKINVKKIFDYSDNSYPIVLWHFDPNRILYTGGIKTNQLRRIYHVVDPYMDIKNDKIFASKCNLIVIVSAKYKNHYDQFNSNVLFIPHGFIENMLPLRHTKAIRIKEKYGTYALLIGTLNNSVSYSTILNILKMFSDITFLVIGKETITDATKLCEFHELVNHPNFQFLGALKTEDLNEYISSAKICLITYDFNLKKPIGTGTPLKTLNYITQYKPIISTIDPEIECLLNKGIFWAKNEQEFIQLFERSINNQLSIDQNLYRKYIAENGIESQIEKILSHINLK